MLVMPRPDCLVSPSIPSAAGGYRRALSFESCGHEGSPRRHRAPQVTFCYTIRIANKESTYFSKKRIIAILTMGTKKLHHSSLTSRSSHKPLGGQASISQEELKLTILFVWHTEDSMLECLYHVSQLPLRPSPPIKVEVRGAPRSNAKAKDSGWVRERKRLEYLKPVDTNEILLRDVDGALLEGTQTNFYVVMEGKLWTAGEGVLEGTVRKLVLEACAAHHIPVILHPPPNLKDLQRWEGALLSSTSRLLLPIDWIGIPQETKSFQEGDVCRAFKYENDCLTSRLVEWVDDNILQSSVDI